MGLMPEIDLSLPHTTLFLFYPFYRGCLFPHRVRYSINVQVLSVHESMKAYCGGAIPPYQIACLTVCPIDRLSIEGSDHAILYHVISFDVVSSPT